MCGIFCTNDDRFSPHLTMMMLFNGLPGEGNMYLIGNDANRCRLVCQDCLDGVSPRPKIKIRDGFAV